MNFAGGQISDNDAHTFPICIKIQRVQSLEEILLACRNKGRDVNDLIQIEFNFQIVFHTSSATASSSMRQKLFLLGDFATISIALHVAHFIRLSKYMETLFKFWCR